MKSGRTSVLFSISIEKVEIRDSRFEIRHSVGVPGKLLSRSGLTVSHGLSKPCVRKATTRWFERKPKSRGDLWSERNQTRTRLTFDSTLIIVPRNGRSNFYFSILEFRLSNLALGASLREGNSQGSNRCPVDKRTSGC